MNLDLALDLIELAILERALDLTDTKTEAAEFVGLSYRSYRYRLQKLKARIHDDDTDDEAAGDQSGDERGSRDVGDEH